MNKRGHWVLAFIANFMFILMTGYFNWHLYYFTTSSLIFMLFIIGFYSILPDIDHKSATMTWTFLGIGILGIVIGVIFIIFKIFNPLALLTGSALLLTFTFISAHWCQHRGIIHSIPAGLLSIIPLWFMFGNLGYCMLAYISWHSHLLGDGFIIKWK